MSCLLLCLTEDAKLNDDSTKHSKEPLLQNIEGVCQSYSKICCFDARILLTPHQAVWIHKKHNGLETYYMNMMEEKPSNMLQGIKLCNSNALNIKI